MKIAEIVGSYADRDEPEAAPDSSLLQTVANAFTRSGKVKRPVNQLPDGQPTAAQITFSSAAGSHGDPVGDVVSNTSTSIDLSNATHGSAPLSHASGGSSLARKQFPMSQAVVGLSRNARRSPPTRGLSEQ